MKQSLVILAVAMTVGMGLGQAMVYWFGLLIGLPGSMLASVGVKKEIKSIEIIGQIASEAGRLFVAITYIVLIVSSLRAFLASHPDAVVGLLWFAALCHGIATSVLLNVPGWGDQERNNESATGDPLDKESRGGLVTLSILALGIMVFRPAWMAWAFDWVPYFGSNL